MSIESRLANVEESLKLLRDADRLQGRPLSAEAPTNRYYLGWDGTAKKWEPKGLVLVVKTADEAVDTSTTLQDDNELLFAIGASERWVFEFFIIWDAQTAADIKFSVTVPSGGAGEWALGKQEATGAGNPTYRVGASFGGSREIQSEADATKYGAHIFGEVLNSTTAGNVTLQWAQVTSDGTATNVFTHSWLRAMQI